METVIRGAGTSAQRVSSSTKQASTATQPGQSSAKRTAADAEAAAQELLAEEEELAARAAAKKSKKQKQKAKKQLQRQQEASSPTPESDIAESSSPPGVKQSGHMTLAAVSATSESQNQARVAAAAPGEFEASAEDSDTHTHYLTLPAFNSGADTTIPSSESLAKAFNLHWQDADCAEASPAPELDELTGTHSPANAAPSGADAQLLQLLSCPITKVHCLITPLHNTVLYSAHRSASSRSSPGTNVLHT